MKKRGKSTKTGKKILKRLRYSNFYVVFSVLVVLTGLAVYMTFFFTQRCENFDCFQNSMEKCRNGITYINDDKQASWHYEIKGKMNSQCEIEVKILQAKGGELEIEKLKGYEMSCFYPKGFSAYPEKDLTKCHGRLKEELQGLIIKKLHSYILENLGEIAGELAGI